MRMVYSSAAGAAGGPRHSLSAPYAASVLADTPRAARATSSLLPRGNSWRAGAAAALHAAELTLEAERVASDAIAYRMTRAVSHAFCTWVAAAAVKQWRSNTLGARARAHTLRRAWSRLVAELVHKARAEDVLVSSARSCFLRTAFTGVRSACARRALRIYAFGASTTGGGGGASGVGGASGHDLADASAAATAEWRDGPPTRAHDARAEWRLRRTPELRALLLGRAPDPPPGARVQLCMLSRSHAAALGALCTWRAWLRERARRGAARKGEERPGAAWGQRVARRGAWRAWVQWTQCALLDALCTRHLRGHRASRAAHEWARAAHARHVAAATAAIGEAAAQAFVTARAFGAWHHYAAHAAHAAAEHVEPPGSRAHVRRALRAPLLRALEALAAAASRRMTAELGRERAEATRARRARLGALGRWASRRAHTPALVPLRPCVRAAPSRALRTSRPGTVAAAAAAPLQYSARVVCACGVRRACAVQRAYVMARALVLARAVRVWLLRSPRRLLRSHAAAAPRRRAAPRARWRVWLVKWLLASPTPASAGAGVGALCVQRLHAHVLRVLSRRARSVLAVWCARAAARAAASRARGAAAAEAAAAERIAQLRRGADAALATRRGALLRWRRAARRRRRQRTGHLALRERARHALRGLAARAHAANLRNRAPATRLPLARWARRTRAVVARASAEAALRTLPLAASPPVMLLGRSDKGAHLDSLSPRAPAAAGLAAATRAWRALAARRGEARRAHVALCASAALEPVARAHAAGRAARRWLRAALSGAADGPPAAYARTHPRPRMHAALPLSVPAHTRALRAWAQLLRRGPRGVGAAAYELAGVSALRAFRMHAVWQRWLVCTALARALPTGSAVYALSRHALRRWAAATRRVRAADLHPSRMLSRWRTRAASGVAARRVAHVHWARGSTAASWRRWIGAAAVAAVDADAVVAGGDARALWRWLGPHVLPARLALWASLIDARGEMEARAAVARVARTRDALHEANDVWAAAAAAWRVRIGDVALRARRARAARNSAAHTPRSAPASPRRPSSAYGTGSVTARRRASRARSRSPLPPPPPTGARSSAASARTLTPSAAFAGAGAASVVPRRPVPPAIPPAAFAPLSPSKPPAPSIPSAHSGQRRLPPRQPGPQPHLLSAPRYGAQRDRQVPSVEGDTMQAMDDANVPAAATHALHARSYAARHAASAPLVRWPGMPSPSQKNSLMHPHHAAETRLSRFR